MQGLDHQPYINTYPNAPNDVGHSMFEPYKLVQRNTQANIRIGISHISPPYNLYAFWVPIQGSPKKSVTLNHSLKDPLLQGTVEEQP